MRREVAAGGDPAARKRDSRSSDKTFGALAERYLAEHSRRHKRSHPMDDRNLRLHVLPHWAKRPCAGIKRADIIALIEGLVTAGKPTLANGVQSLVSSIFTFAMDASLTESNPCHRLRQRGSVKAGTRVLSDDEIRLFWSGIVAGSKNRRAGLALRLALLTGTRAGEVAGLCRSEVENIGDEAKAAWTIPAIRSKNKREHLVPLSPPARATVIELMELAGAEQPYLVPTHSRRRQGPMRANGIWWALDHFRDQLPGDDDATRTWRLDAPSPHDLRRTVETRLAELRIPKEIRDRVLNHAAGDVGSKHYNRHDYADEKREALDRWSHVLAAILEPRGAVIPIAIAKAGKRPSR
jgi:integrase